MSIASLTDLFTPAGLFADADGDGLPDGLRVRFSVGRTPGAIDVAARLGLETAALTTGFTDPAAEGRTLFFGPDNPDCPPLKFPPGQGAVMLTQKGDVVVTGAGPAEGWMAARWLAETFPYIGPGSDDTLAKVAEGQAVRGVTVEQGRVAGLLFGTYSEPLADKPTVTGAPPEPPFQPEPVGDLPPEGPSRLFTVAGLLGSADGVQPDRAGWQVAVGPETTPAEIAALCELAARTGLEATGLLFPLAVTVGERLTADVVVVLARTAPADAVWSEGGLAWSPGRLTAFGQPAARVASLRSAAASAGLTAGLHDTLRTRRANLAPALAERPDPVFDLVIEQEGEVERFWKVWSQHVLPRVQPVQPVFVDLRISEPLGVRAALAEEIVRSLGGRGVPTVDIRVLSAYKQGFHWLEEEVLPTLKQSGPIGRVTVTCSRFAPAPNQAAPEDAPLDLPVRWLQELYPADELMAATLGAPVSFTLAAAPQHFVYQLVAYRPDGSVGYEEGFSPVHASRPYLPEFPHRGRVHPPTGLLRVEQGGTPVAELGFDTDAETFWTAYQKEVLPRVRSYIAERFGPTPDPAAQPFFDALVIEVALSEDDRRLGIREEQISPLDAMHEDLYFYTLDYLSELGVHLTGKGYPAPGAVEPWVVGGEGGPVARVRLYPRRPDAATGLHPGPASVETPEAAPLPIPDDEIISPDALPAHLAYLAGLPHVRAWRTGLSYAGRPTWAMTVTAPTAGAIAPPQKLSAWRPTLLINARHHANEVSSTNSILKLAESAANDPDLLRKLNLVLSPLANPDGAALHYAMQQVHPYWKLHAARFNATGVDFHADSFTAEPRFGEARTVPTLWRATLPDVVLDDHGYPSHEWVQPFSGYNSPPYFKTSWWMPNAMIYGIHRNTDPEVFPANARVQETLRSDMAERFATTPEIADYTRLQMDCFIRYGNRYLPETFPLQIHHGVVSMASQGPHGPQVRSYVGRFPHITAAEVVTEVPDETAQGEYLAQCVRAHLAGDQAVVAVLTAQPQPVIRRRSRVGERTLWTVGRERPLKV